MAHERVEGSCGDATFPRATLITIFPKLYRRKCFARGMLACAPRRVTAIAAALAARVAARASVSPSPIPTASHDPINAQVGVGPKPSTKPLAV